MLGDLFNWMLLLFEPFADWLFIEPIPIQPRLQTINRPYQDIVTGVYGVPPLIKIHDRDGVIKWTWEREDVTQELPDGLLRCLYSEANDATDLKWMRNGTSLGGVYSDLIMVVNHHPQNPETDKFITFATCRDNEFMWNAHAVEGLPGDLMAVGTTGHRPWDGILVFNISTSLPLVENAPVHQNITHLPGIHALIWEESTRILWAAGTDVAPDGSEGMPATGLVVGYPFNAETGLLDEENKITYVVGEPGELVAEWGDDYGWWAGPHDIVPIPHDRKFILVNDLGVYLLDLDEGNFTMTNQEVIDAYLPGFEPTMPGRQGTNSKGEWTDFSLGDIKGLSLAPDGTFVYVQALIQKVRGFHTNVVTHGNRHKINIGDEIYRSRFWDPMPGWPKAAT
ncbi:hypothetical protein N7492_008269 [Penicillium capsulatum]|uniref:Uncharacterized protein n=1 Tax=Penicillium capsulatum TaxID=69766 RepID=A0A9W9HT44_9EURO|nr:hypothetical protein N7492_008269 [Penicillium capsulatum]KAJ6105678.1 hypothetical protein N7512_009195 [Penicillium capsulatum]